MTALDTLRDDGPLAGPARRRLPVPEPLLLGLALLAALPVAALDPARRWAWVLVGVALALLGRVGREPRRLGWPVPALLRALEYGAVLVVAGGSAWSFGLLSALAFHHYDVVYRLRLWSAPPPRWLGFVTGGWAGRLLVLTAAEAAGALGPVLRVLTVWLAGVFLAESLVARRAAGD